MTKNELSVSLKQIKKTVERTYYYKIIHYYTLFKKKFNSMLMFVIVIKV